MHTRLLRTAACAAAMGLATLAVAGIPGCACERRIGIEGDGDAGEGWDAGEEGGTADAVDTADWWEVVGPDAPVVGDPSWDPPIENLGETGWRDSFEPLCTPAGNVHMGYGVWSDGRGVFAVIGMAVEGADALNDIFFNDGSGWIAPFSDGGTASDYQSVVVHIRGLEGGNLFGWGGGLESFYMFKEGGVVEPISADASDVFAVGSARAYATLMRDPRLLQYNGTSWGPYPGEPMPFEVNRVWADEDVIYCGGESGIVMSTTGDGWTVHDTGTLANITAIWGFGPDDVWAAGTMPDVLLHYDGNDWTPVDWPTMTEPGGDECAGSRAIAGFWGKDGALFFHTGRELVMWDGTEFRNIAYWPGHRDGSGLYCLGGIAIADLWGYSRNEVFLAVSDPAHAATDCGNEYMLWWDGAEFHWF